MKASEVFDLPATDADVYELVVRHGKAEEKKAITNCINHADALADALECLFESYKSLADSGDAGNWMLEDLEVGEQAIKALAAYRGAK